MYSYLTPFIQECVLKDKDLAESLKFEIDRRIYHYGDHFYKSYEMERTSKLHQLSLFMRQILLRVKASWTNKSGHLPPNSIVSTSYVSINKNLESSSHQFIRPPWDLSLKQDVYCSLETFSRFNQIKKLLLISDFNTLLQETTLNQFRALKPELERFFSHPSIKGALFPNDVGFFETQSIKILKKLKKPSMILLHGMPAVYTPEMYNRSDYLLVWGRGQKEIFIKFGFDSEKIKIVGHPTAGRVPSSIKSSLESILILGSPLPGSQHHQNKLILRDRGNIVLYCYLIEKVLTELGVKSVKIRPHPSENKQWYKKYINNNFFVMDESPSIREALKKSSLVIGPSSSSSLESIQEGVNYVVFEPFNNENKNSPYELVAPFDGSEPRLLVAKNEEALLTILKSNKRCDPSILADFLGEEFCLDRVLNELL